MKFTLALLVGIASAAPTELLKRADATCGSVHYSSDAVNQAAQASCKLVKDHDTAGSSSYPHQYKNYEGFEFKGLNGPFYEFPILKSGSVYNGGSPGADRVIITSSCQQAGVITHQGASGNNFVACEGGSDGSDDPEESLGWAVSASDMSAARAALALGSVVFMYIL